MFPIRPDDLFFGGASTDWVNTNRIAIPQADEQQRLLVNLIESAAADEHPIPRFWYLPFGEKAAVVMTGDDHAVGGTAGRFDQYKALSPAGCSVVDWECVRGTSYIYPNSPLTNAQAQGYVADGFEVALHLNVAGGPCGNWTPAQLANLLHDAALAVRGEVHERARARHGADALRGLERLGVTAEDRARARDPAGHELLPLPGILDRDEARLHDRLRHSHAVRRPRRQPDRRVPGGHADDRRVRPGLPGHGQHAPRQGARARGLLRDLHREHAHRPGVVAGLRRDRRVGPGPLACRSSARADAHVARRPRGLRLPLDRLERRHAELHRPRPGPAPAASRRCSRRRGRAGRSAP